MSSTGRHFPLSQDMSMTERHGLQFITMEGVNQQERRTHSFVTRHVQDRKTLSLVYLSAELK